MTPPPDFLRTSAGAGIDFTIALTGAGIDFRRATVDVHMDISITFDNPLLFDLELGNLSASLLLFDKDGVDTPFVLKLFVSDLAPAMPHFVDRFALTSSVAMPGQESAMVTIP